VSPPEKLVREALERQVPLRQERAPDWQDVLDRARPPRVPRTLAAAAVVAALAVVASALAATGRDPFGAISSWLGGAPGEKASRAEQAAFTGRQGASYAAFPAGVDVRRVGRAEAGGTSFTLLGFSSGHSLCLRVARAEQPKSRGANECVTRDELAASPAPALVASEARFYLGKNRPVVEGIFGLADDTVQAIEYRRGRGPWARVAVANNVFLALDAHVPGTFRHPNRVEPIVAVRAVRRSGERVRVPFVAGFVSYAGGVPAVPSYMAFSPSRPEDLPGPTTVNRNVRATPPAWLARGDNRGSDWKPSGRSVEHLGIVVHSRAVQPDPDDPFRVGLFIVRNRGATRLCATGLRPLGGTTGVTCLRRTTEALLAEAGTVFTGPGMSQRPHLAGGVPDGVASLQLFLASGRVIPVALRDNAYVVSAPTSQLPAKLVAYDDEGRVVGLQVIRGPARPVPCPTVTVWAASRLPSTKPYQRLDLGALTVNGAPIFGHSPAEVEAVLGTPDRGGKPPAGSRYRSFLYGGTLPEGAELVVDFGWHQGRLRADNLSFHGRGLVDEKLGRLLNVQPQTLDRRLAASYGGVYHRTAEYGALPRFFGPSGCSGEFRDRAGVVWISYGVEPRTGRPFLTLHHPY
jgi:hypothetical protein